MDDLNAKHEKMLDVLFAVCTQERTSEISLVSEWLGYAPFGLYVWVNVGSRTNVDQEFCLGQESWDSADFDCLKKKGFVELIEKKVHSDDGMDSVTRYRLTSKYKTKHRD